MNRRPNKYALPLTSQGEATKKVPSVMTRQRIRAALRKDCYATLQRDFGGESRHTLRLMSFRLAARRYKQQTTGVVTGGKAHGKA